MPSRTSGHAAPTWRWADGQSVDLDGVGSLRDNPAHVPSSPFTSYNYHGKGNVASLLECVVLGATEVDVDFNATP